jgi:15-cis-phytoene synthase
MAQLPLRSAWAIGTARAVYREIGHEVIRRGPLAWATRVSTSKPQKIWAAAAGGVHALDARSRGQLITAPPRTGLWTRPKG